MMRRNLLPTLALASLIGIGCEFGTGDSRKDLAGGDGGGFEGEALALSGQIFYPDGRPAALAHVRLRAESFLKVEDSAQWKDTVTDSLGRFTLNGVESGGYHLEVNDGNFQALLVSVQIGDIKAGDSLRLAPDTLKPTGSIRGRVVWPDSLSGSVIKGQVQVAGLDRLAYLDTAGNWLLEGLPSGTYRIRILFPELPASREISGLTIRSGETLNAGTVTLSPAAGEDYATWAYSRNVYLNTTPQGADIPGDIHAFPLLVRLDSSNLNFQQVALLADGADLRFSKSDGTPLAYEVEAWSPANRRAVVWVKMDTVFGNRSDQFFRLHWGKPAVFSRSDAATVFDTANGFAGVWHFPTALPMNDATRNRNHGVNGGSEWFWGFAGPSRKFDAKDRITIPNRPSLEPASLTVSCWIRREGRLLQWSRFVYKGGPGPYFASYTLDMRKPEGGLSFKVAKQDKANPTIEAPDAVPENTWMHVAGTYDAKSGIGRIYVDGSLRKTFTQSSPLYYPAQAYSLIIGNQEDRGMPFLGSIDEVRVLRSAVPPDRIRLDAESQKESSRLLEFR